MRTGPGSCALHEVGQINMSCQTTFETTLVVATARGPHARLLNPRDCVKVEKHQATTREIIMRTRLGCNAWSKLEGPTADECHRPVSVLPANADSPEYLRRSIGLCDEQTDAALCVSVC